MILKSIDMKTTYNLILISILLGFILSASPLFGWSYYTPEAALTSCGVEWSEKSFNVISYTVIACFALYIFPLLAIVFISVKFYKLVSNT